MGHHSRGKGSEDTGGVDRSYVEDDSTGLSSSSAARDGSRGKSVHNGETACNKAPSRAQADTGVQCLLISKTVEDGNSDALSNALSNSLSREGADKGSASEDGMIFEIGGGADAPC